MRHLNRNIYVGLALCSAFLIAALISIAWTPYSIFEQSIPDNFQLYTWSHWLGTDQYGRDVLSLLMVGTKNSLLIALAAVGIGAGLGIPLGLCAAAKGGWVNEVLARTSDLAFAFPSLLTAILLTARYGPSNVNAMIAIGIFNIPVFARLTRGSAKLIWSLPFVHAAMTLGKSATRISIEHILPNLAALLIVQATIQLALGILAEAGLSFLGWGTQPPDPSLGKMLQESQTLRYLAPRLVFIPGVTIILMVLGLNLLGDGLRDYLDPKLRERGSL